jgi:hypothetical protein
LNEDNEPAQGTSHALRKIQEATFLLNNFFLPKGGMVLCRLKDHPKDLFKWKYVEHYKQLTVVPPPETFEDFEDEKNHLRLRSIESRLLKYFNETLRMVKDNNGLDCTFLFNDQLSKGPLILDSVTMTVYKRELDEEEMINIESILKEANSEFNIRRNYARASEKGTSEPL